MQKPKEYQMWDDYFQLKPNVCQRNRNWNSVDLCGAKKSTHVKNEWTEKLNRINMITLITV